MQSDPIHAVKSRASRVLYREGVAELERHGLYRPG
jgi:hypothetical protein